jgi:acetolactate decarboxylase
MKKLFLILLITPLFIFAQGKDVLFQYSTIGALMSGNYDGNLNFENLAKHGDFGLGTIENLDGEMLALNGKFYQIKSDGKVIETSGNIETPFAIVKFFKPDKSISLKGNYSAKQVIAILDSIFSGNNYPVAIKGTAKFETIKTRSVPAQTRPYPTLVEAVKNQTIFNFENVRGTLIGFWFPKYFDGINVPGYHLHFLSDDKQKGGHVIDYIIHDPEIQLDYSSNFNLQLLDKFEDGSTLLVPQKNELEKVEK